MGRLVVFESVSLDGVMQAPARPDEDPRGGFAHGGWALPYHDHVMLSAMGSTGGEGGGPILLGRRTYEDFANVWPRMPEDNPYTKVINAAPKYVVSSTLRTPLGWNNSHLLSGDVAEAVAGLKARLDEHIVVLGSGELVRELMRHDLVDRYVLLIFPLVLGQGIRLLDEAYAKLELADTKPTTTGVIIATYEPAKERA